MERELRRFKNPLLHDPIARVAKDPLRKLSADDRLVQALKLVHNTGLDPYPLLLCINAALEGAASGHVGLNEERADPLWRRQILETVSGLRDDQLIHDILTVAGGEVVA
jgi:mannitol-1-phosphate/altronate dehydrogenase